MSKPKPKVEPPKDENPEGEEKKEEKMEEEKKEEKMEEDKPQDLPASKSAGNNGTQPNSDHTPSAAPATESNHVEDMDVD